MQKLHYPPPGSAPTTVPVPAKSESHPTTIKLIEYDAHSFVEKEVSAVDELVDCLENEKVTWVNIEGLGSLELLHEIGQLFQIHTLAITDVLTLGQRPHLDAYDRQIFLLMQMVYHNEELELVFEQLSILVGERFVLSFQDATANFMDLYVSSLTMRTNEIVRVLTVISSIFIPLTFITGLYGMNFDRSSSVLNMPELSSPIGYPVVLLVMAAVAGGMLLYFKRKRWL